MSKLDEIQDESGAPLMFRDKTKQQIKDLILELIGEPEERETGDLSLKSWTNDDYKAFGKNELIIELKRKVSEL